MAREEDEDKTYHVGDAVLDSIDMLALRADHLAVRDHNLLCAIYMSTQLRVRSRGLPQAHLEEDMVQRLEQVERDSLRLRDIGALFRKVGITELQTQEDCQRVVSSKHSCLLTLSSAEGKLHFAFPQASHRTSVPRGFRHICDAVIRPHASDPTYSSVEAARGR